MCKACEVSKEDNAANRALRSIFDDGYVYDETFRRIKADPELQAVLDAYNAGCVAYDEGKMSDGDFNALENSYYTEVFSPVSVAVAKEVLDRAIEMVQYEPYGPKGEDDV